LRTPRDYRTPKVYGEAKKQLRAILTGKHPHVPRLNKTQMICSIANFKCAATDPRFRPVKKQLLKKLSINEFIWEPYTNKSQLLIFTNGVLKGSLSANAMPTASDEAEPEGNATAVPLAKRRAPRAAAKRG
jgi:hypothetical protein